MGLCVLCFLMAKSNTCHHILNKHIANKEDDSTVAVKFTFKLKSIEHFPGPLTGTELMIMAEFCKTTPHVYPGILAHGLRET